jgi:hypothetical protein
MAEFKLDPGLDETGAAAAIAQAMAAGTLTAAQAGTALANYTKERAAQAAKESTRKPYSKTATGSVYLSLGRNEKGQAPRAVNLRKEDWERLPALVAEILETWDEIPLSASAKLTPEQRDAKREKYKATKAARAAA